jgi:hypothetical protein
LSQARNYLLGLSLQGGPAAREPHCRAFVSQVVLNFSANVGHGKGAEGQAAADVEALDGLN